MASALIPVILITGFLGSGKTTPLQRLLKSPELGTTAVLINEFGEVGLDHYLLQRVDQATAQERLRLVHHPRRPPRFHVRP
jgi:G3E family GTPase